MKIIEVMDTKYEVHSVLSNPTDDTVSFYKNHFTKKWGDFSLIRERGASTNYLLCRKVDEVEEYLGKSD